MARNEPRLHRIEPQLGLLNAISITICTIIGSGIFISPKGVYQNVGSVGISFFVWIICGITALFTDLCWVELALAMPKFGGDKVVSFDNSFSNIKWGNLGLAYYAASWSFSGGDSIMSATEEFVNPKRSFPRAIYISTTIVICLYLLVNFAYFAVLTPDEILLSNAVAVTFAEKTLGQFRWLIPVFVALSTTLMNSFLAQPRAYYATARDGMFPGIMALVSVKYRTPVGSIIVTCFVSVIYVFVNDIWTLLNYFGFVGACCDALALSTLFVMRWCRPDIHKPFMVPIIFPLIAIAISFGAVVLATVSSPIDALVGLALTLSVVPAYLIGVYPKTKVAVAGKISGNLTRFVQMLTVSSPEDKVDLQ
ncbi:large neutral amino acids transporter small subunit 2-like isoform X5 [Anneissia japonica]|uniref:large neutral amino acids transporter small subunit 2-like isoform X5 n=1 Tax=Anneissia japonica TaxID=1529436 RepID=UPI0014257D29|nr:large neutral amino acids transporter small subunit 2-like isoform X5 [Anneissia japonica]